MSKLEVVSEPFRKADIARNEFNYNNEYTTGNPEEISPLGKDENTAGDVGSAADIAQRKKLITKNKFNYNREYNAGTA
jgi:hypothetical protein